MDKPKEKKLQETPYKTDCSYCGHYIWHPAWSNPDYRAPMNEAAYLTCPKIDCSCRQHRDR
jgi:hypothetical protein